MTILYIYIGTVIVTIAVDVFADKYVEKEVENRGYQSKKEPKNIYKSIICGIKNYVHFFIPIWNLCLASYEFSKIDKICEDFIEQSILNGDLIKKEESNPIKDKADENTNIDLSKKNVIIYNTHKELTREEKIKFLKEEYARLMAQDFENSLIQKDNGEKQKRI